MRIKQITSPIGGSVAGAIAAAFLTMSTVAVSTATEPDINKTAALFPAPRTQAELDFRMAELRKQYEPYLRSLPKPLNVRTRTVLEGPWRINDEGAPKKKDRKQY